ncbi:c-type cytochrome biogenesis protein CcmI [Oceanobacter mangrovi]|uniref:c-type cytochrome biogenesis protein CcmI n=1 Tax=Oceanobacter mangrovi TaxID=2862510 RepID=UPI001C8EC0C9|nr:c-type cytochrome biogenesis protein CcmI [Oceanobacter mangrovi]
MIWLLLVLLVPLALLLLRPVWYQPQANVQSEENRRLYQERTEELKTADLEDDERQVMQLELDREFLASATAEKEQLAIGKGQWPLLLVMVLIAGLGTFLLYGFWGADNELRATALLNKGGQVELTSKERDELMQRMAVAARAHSDNPEWAYLNARLLSANGDYDKAVAEFQKILSGLPEDATADRAATLTLLAEARFFAADQQADATTYALLQQAIDLSPNNRQALGLAGIMAFELGKLEQAIQYWKQLWMSLPAGPESQILVQGIQRAAEELQQQGTEVDLSWLERAGLRVAVDISPQARAAVAPTDTVFVLARAVSGPPAPLAVQRLTVADLPVKLTLDNSMAMVAGMNIGSFEQVALVARVSKSGQPMPQPGDWEITLSPVNTSEAGPYQLVISNPVE